MDSHGGPDPLIDLVVTFRASDGNRHPQSRERDEHIMQDIVRVPDPDNLFTLQDGERVNLVDDLGHCVLGTGRVQFGILQRLGGVIHLVHGQQVGENLSGMVEIREGVDDRYGRVLDECL